MTRFHAYDVQTTPTQLRFPCSYYFGRVCHIGSDYAFSNNISNVGFNYITGRADRGKEVQRKVTHDIMGMSERICGTGSGRKKNSVQI